MSERNSIDQWPMVAALVITILVANMALGLFTGWRDRHHIRDLQRRVAELEKSK